MFPISTLERGGGGVISRPFGKLFKRGGKVKLEEIKKKFKEKREIGRKSGKRKQKKK